MRTTNPRITSPPRTGRRGPRRARAGGRLAATALLVTVSCAGCTVVVSGKGDGPGAPASGAGSVAGSTAPSVAPTPGSPAPVTPSTPGRTGAAGAPSAPNAPSAVPTARTYRVSSDRPGFLVTFRQGSHYEHERAPGLTWTRTVDAASSAARPVVTATAVPGAQFVECTVTQDTSVSRTRAGGPNAEIQCS